MRTFWIIREAVFLFLSTSLGTVIFCQSIGPLWMVPEKAFNLRTFFFFGSSFLRLHSHHPPTYESASIRKFKKGRTETIRSATPAAARYAREMDRTNYSVWNNTFRLSIITHSLTQPEARNALYSLFFPVFFRFPKTWNIIHPIFDINLRRTSNKISIIKEVIFSVLPLCFKIDRLNQVREDKTTTKRRLLLYYEKFSNPIPYDFFTWS